MYCSGRFPGEHGVVAPGLSCQHPIKFAPDSLADYDDFLKVHAFGWNFTHLFKNLGIKDGATLYRDIFASFKLI